MVWRPAPVVAVVAALAGSVASPLAVAPALGRFHAPSAPRDLRVNAREVAVRLSWSEPGGLRGLRFELRVVRRGDRVRRLFEVGSSGRARVRGLRVSTPYIVDVRACRRSRCSSWSRPEAFELASHGRTAPVSVRASPTIGGCALFPADNSFNRDISTDAVDPRSDAYVASIGAGGHLHPDFGSDPSYGIPYRVVAQSQPLVPIHLTDYADQSDPGPYPVPPDAPVEAGSDRHVLVLARGSCRLFELFDASFSGAVDHHWSAAAGAVFDLSSDALRPDGWTSADAAGLPILPGLVRPDEVRSGLIRHAIRMTVLHTQRGFIHPATHFASSSTDPRLPPMGLRLRLKASYDIASFPHDARVILTALKTYGLIVADNGSNWYLSGATDPGWHDDQINTLKQVPGSAFEVVRSGHLQH